MNKRLLLTFAAILAGMSLHAQAAQEDFLLESSHFAYRFNPALGDFKKFISIGGISGANATNLGASTFLYPQGDKVVTAFNSSISAETFLGKLKEDNYSSGRFNLNLFAYGFARGDNYHTFEAGIKGYYSATVPKKFFEILKVGSPEGNVDFSNLQSSLGTYAEFAYGWTRRIGDIFSVGARAKLLVGLAGGSLDVTRLDVDLGSESYVVNADADLAMTSSFVSLVREDEEDAKKTKKEKRKDKWHHPQSSGLAFDLGMAVRPNDYLTLSMSLLDVGGILWFYDDAGHSSGSATFDGLDISYDQLNTAGLFESLNEVGQEFMDALAFDKVKKFKKFRTLPFQANVGAKYILPFHEKMTVGVTGSFSGYWPMNYCEGLLGVSERFTSWLEVSANAGWDNYGPVFGAATSLRADKFRFNIGVHNNFRKTMPHSFLPLHPGAVLLNASVTYDL